MHFYFYKQDRLEVMMSLNLLYPVLDISIEIEAYELAHCDPKQLQYKLGKTYIRPDLEMVAQSSLHAAVASGRIEVVGIILGTLIEQGNFNEEVKSLLIACSKGYINIVTMLVDSYDVNIFECDQHGRTALHVACYYGHTQLVDILVNQFHMNPMLRDENGDTCFHHAAFGGTESTVNFLITRTWCKNLVNYRNNDGQTPLHLASVKGSVSVVGMLVSLCEPDLKALDVMNEAPIHKAASRGYAEIVHILINHGCPDDYNNGNKQTALHLACNSGHSDVVRVVLTNHKAGLTVCDEHNNTPLDVAIRNGKEKVISFLITYCDFDINAKYVLHCACRQGHTKVIIDILLKGHIDLNLLSLDNDGNIPLHIAAQYGHEAVMRILTDKYGCPVDQRNNKSETSLHLACNKGYLGS